MGTPSTPRAGGGGTETPARGSEEPKPPRGHGRAAPRRAGGFRAGEGSTGVFWGGTQSRNLSEEPKTRALPEDPTARRVPAWLRIAPSALLPAPRGHKPLATACVGGPKTLGSQGRTLRRAAVPAPRAWSTKRALRQAQLGEELCHPVLRPCWSLGRLGTGFGVNGVGFGANRVEKGQQGPGPSCVVLTGTSGRQLHVSMTKAPLCSPGCCLSWMRP